MSLGPSFLGFPGRQRRANSSYHAKCIYNKVLWGSGVRLGAVNVCLLLRRYSRLYGEETRGGVLPAAAGAAQER